MIERRVIFFWLAFQAAQLFSDSQEGYQAHVYPITSAIEERMCYSWKKNNPVPLSDLRYLVVTYLGFDDLPHRGELVVHKEVVEDLIEIFAELFLARFPIERMELIDLFQGDDELSMAANNSSAFCSRMITGSSNRFSLHSYGVAIDINPKLNPYVRGDIVLPPEGRLYLDRDGKVAGLIDEGGICHQAFSKRGWEWGGLWSTLKDYQHFQKKID